MKCPKCDYERTAHDDEHFPKTECPACGINYSKFTETWDKKELMKQRADAQKKEEQELLTIKEKAEKKAAEINAMPPKKRIKAIRNMDLYDRKTYLQTESTIAALQGKGIIERQRYLFGGVFGAVADVLETIRGIILLLGLSLGGIVGVALLVQFCSITSPPSYDRVASSPYDGSVRQVKSWIKTNAKDPDSIEFIEWSPVTSSGSGYSVHVKYRGKNSFGGYTIENQVFTLDSSGTILGVSDY